MKDLYAQVYAGALAVLAILLAVVGLLIPEYRQYFADDYLRRQYELLLYSVVGLSVLSGIAAYGCMEGMRGKNWPEWLILWPARLLIAGTVALTIVLVVAL